jgi:hypothetical protein
METERKWFIICAAALLIAACCNTHLRASPVDEAIKAVAKTLVKEQTQKGADSGSWPGETGFTGSIATGMVDAYAWTGNTTYLASAESAGHYILSVSNGNLFADEALVLTRLSDLADDPFDNIWRAAVDGFYSKVKNSPGGTQGYISYYFGLEPSVVVLCLAEHVVAAHNADAEDVEVWRQGLIESLSHVDDMSNFPVLALGSATWALAQSGPLDDTLIDPLGVGTPYWNDTRLQDLPVILLSHQVPQGQPFAGSFYWRFDHGGMPSAGYTEDTIFATLGLVSASGAAIELSEQELESDIVAADAALIDSVSPDGKVSEQLSQEGSAYCVYAGEMLQALCLLAGLDLEG